MAEPPSLFIHTYSNYDLKLGRAIYAATALNHQHLEAPYYEIWDLVLNDLILEKKDYSCRPQGALSAHIEEGRWGKKEIIKRIPDFILYHSQDIVPDTAIRGVQHTRAVAFIAEVKPWMPGMGDSADNRIVLSHFRRREFLSQVRDHAKLIMASEGGPASGPVWLVQCVGMFWRAGKVEDCKRLSPISNTRRRSKKNHPPVYDLQWGPIQKVGERASDEELFKFWQQMSNAVECV
jgi:hypothetical protein